MQYRINKSDNLIGKAVFSDDMTRRYFLSREWNDLPLIRFIMLNPSIGDEKVLETTTKGVMKRVQTWDFGGMVVVNMFSLISTNPNGIRGEEIETDNDNHIRLTNGLPTVCAWGNNGLKYQDHMLELLKDIPLYCLGTNKNGTPKHPLHMSHSIGIQEWKI